MLPPAIDSAIFGRLTLHESEIRLGGLRERTCSYESQLRLGNREIRIVLNPDFVWPYPNDAETQIRKLLEKSEKIHVKLHDIGIDGIFKLQRSQICSLGEGCGYDRWKASEEQLLMNWMLESEIYFVGEFRLIFAEHPIYYLALLLEFDCDFHPTCAQFDG